MHRIEIDLLNSGKFNAGPKAREDVSWILSQRGFRTIRLLFSRQRPIISFFNILSAIWKIPFNSEVFLQYPLGNQYSSLFLLILLSIKKAKITILIHDIVSYRFTGRLSKIELIGLKFGDFVIVHTEEMKLLLSQKIVGQKLMVLNLFDYLVKSSSEGYIVRDDRILFAGNLDKSQFVSLLKNLPLKFDLFGNLKSDPSAICNQSIRYRGVFQPSDLSSLCASWGLVWDGDSLDSCTGLMGSYQMINAPHKLSLYIAAGIPVIVWKKAAVASFVENNKLGISVNSLCEIEGRFHSISNEEYNTMKENVQTCSQKLRSGQMLSRIIDKIVFCDGSF